MGLRSCALSATLFALSVLRCSETADAVNCSRASGPEEKNATPKFLCSVTVDVLATNCSTQVKETLVFPHTTGRDATRDVVVLSSAGERIENVHVARNGAPIDSTIESRSDTEVRVTIPTEQNADPVAVSIDYEIAGGVLRFTESCVDNVEPDPSLSVIRWTAGQWDKEFDSLEVMFRTSGSEEMKLIGGVGAGLELGHVGWQRDIVGEGPKCGPRRNGGC
jgi:hypothetical protein